MGSMPIKPQDLQDAQDILNNLKSGEASRRDLVALLIYIREYLPDDMVKDIAHCIAHSTRDRGHAYSYIESFVSHFIGIAERGGILVVKPLFPVHELLSRLYSDLSTIGFNVSMSDLSEQATKIEAILSDILASTSLMLRNKHVASCQFMKHAVEGRDTLAFVVQTRDLTPGVLTIPENAKMAFPVF